MFSIFSKRKKLFISLAVSAIFCALLIFILHRSFYVPSEVYLDGIGEVSLSAQTSDERESFFAPFGFRAESLYSYEMKVPSKGRVFEEYNEIQKRQGLDLTQYSSKSATMHILSLTDDEGESFYGFLIVCKDRVIGAHISDCRYPSAVRGLWG